MTNEAAEAHIVPTPTATKIILDYPFARQISIALRTMRKTWDDVESGEVIVSFVEQSPDPRTWALVLRVKDESPAREADSKDFR